MKGWGKKILFIIVLLVAAGYTGLWFYYATNAKSQAKKIIVQIQEEKSSGAAPDIAIGDISVSGFPLHFNIAVSHIAVKLTPAMLQTMHRPDAPIGGIHIDKPVKLEIDVFGKELRLVLPTKFTIDGKEGNLPLELQMNEDAVWRLLLAKSPAELFIASGNPVPWDKQRLIEHFREFSFVATGGKALLGDKPLSANGPFDIRLSNVSLGEGNSRVTLKFSAQELQTLADDATIALYTEYGLLEQKEFIQYMFEHARSAGKGSMRLDGEFTGPLEGIALRQKDSQLIVNDIGFGNSLHALKISGKIQKAGSDPLPIGSMSLQIANYPALLEHYFRYMEYMIKSVNMTMQRTGQTAPPFLPVLESLPVMKQTVTNLLMQAGEVSGDNMQNVALYLHREAGGQFYFGKMPMSEVMMLLQSGMTPQGAVPPIPLEPEKVN